MVSVPLLTTKLHFPQARPNLIHRARLVERLNTGLRESLTLIAAPAGYGKTTLVSDWRAGSGRNMPAAWLSLEAEDNDIVRFLIYLAFALDTIKTGLLDHHLPLLQTSPLPPIDAILLPLINELNGLKRDFTLILDDYQEISNLAIHEGIAYLLDHLPPCMHLVLWAVFIIAAFSRQ